MTFGQKLKAAREKAGMTQAQLSEASGIPLGTIRDYEQTRRDPSYSVATRLSQSIGVSLDEFAAENTGAEPPKRLVRAKRKSS